MSALECVLKQVSQAVACLTVTRVVEGPTEPSIRRPSSLGPLLRGTLCTDSLEPSAGHWYWLGLVTYLQGETSHPVLSSRRAAIRGLRGPPWYSEGPAMTTGAVRAHSRGPWPHWPSKTRKQVSIESGNRIKDVRQLQDQETRSRHLL